MDTVVLTPVSAPPKLDPGQKLSTLGEAPNEDVRSPTGARRHDGVSVDGGRDYRDAGSKLGAMRERRVVGPDG